MEHSKLLQKWKVAASELGLDIVAPFDLDLGDGITLKCQLLLRNFGGANGMLIVTSYAPIEPHLMQIQNMGYGFSVLRAPRNTENEAYDRNEFIDVLNDWGWTGPEIAKPDWLKKL